MILPLNELAALRRDLHEFGKRRRSSIRAFYDTKHGWFRLTRDGTGTADDKAVKHLTTTMTCLESLHETPLNDKELATAAGLQVDADPQHPTTTPEHDDTCDHVTWLHAATRSYIHLALQHRPDWKSDGAAFVYCRVRTLGAMGRLLDPHDPLLTTHADALGTLLQDAWTSHDDAPAFGLREETDDPAAEPAGDTTSVAVDAYIPNSFLTYWGLLALDAVPEVSRPQDWANQRDAALAWLRKSLAQQVAFHYSRSAMSDPQQLAWALCALVRYADDQAMTAKTSQPYAELISGLQAFFAQQDDDGDWPQGQPLFFYLHAGNAYCYPYETVGELLSLATGKSAASKMLREALWPYADQLAKLFRKAEHTAQRMDDEGFGWASGHNPRRLDPEAWATASVYRFADALRRLAGSWANDQARQLLEARRADSTRDDLRERGDTWDAGAGSAGLQLSTGFLNPILHAEVVRKALAVHEPDPDLPVIPGHGATSAILYGPPGTGKTTLVEALAGSLGWPFVEITPALFLDQGVEMVSARADEIFRQIMQLNRCVVLLDEIDELIRARDGKSDPVERFFTTTMLPRLAKLWKAKRILFFVNTNDILQVDPAIRRSQRFDAAIFVLPPGLAAKRQALENQDVPTSELAEDAILATLRSPDNAAKDARVLAWLPFLRYDQLERFANEAAKNGAGVAATLPTFIAELRALDWSPEPDDDDKDKADAQAPDVLPENLRRLLAAQRTDHTVRHELKLEGVQATALGLDADHGFACAPTPLHELTAWASRNHVRLTADGIVQPPEPA